MTLTTTSAGAIVSDAYFPALRDHIISATGLVFYATRAEALAAPIGARLGERGLDGCRSYLELLQCETAAGTELDQLVERLTIGETYFFRHSELFDALRDAALPEIIDRNRNSRCLRIWSAGCSIGAEVYSLSIVLRCDLGHLLQGWNISILGTDINRTFLAQADAGEYEEWAFRGTAPELRRECFEQRDKTWRIASRFREGVAFAYHNLASEPYSPPLRTPGGFDLILCRNVLIYFAPEFTERLVSKFAECLAPEGWLAVGHAEHGSHFKSAFETVTFPGSILYRKSPPHTTRTTSREARYLHGACATLHSASAIGASELFLHGAHRTVAVGSVGLASSKNGDNSAAGPTQTLNILQQIGMLADEGRIDAALELCTRQLDREPLNPSGHFYEALLLDLVDQHAAALQSLQKTIYLDRKFVLAYYYAGLIHEKLGHAREATISFRNVEPLLAERPQDEPLVDAGGLSIADLRKLTRMHLESLEAP
jgi:chemotaxis protein methyltransferase CheR